MNHPSDSLCAPTGITHWLIMSEPQKTTACQIYAAAALHRETFVNVLLRLTPSLGKFLLQNCGHETNKRKRKKLHIYKRCSWLLPVPLFILIKEYISSQKNVHCFTSLMLVLKDKQIFKETAESVVEIK